MDNLGQYFDMNATTPPSQLVLSQVSSWAQAWGNPSSIHEKSRQPKNILRESRKNIADSLQVSPLEIIFTSGGSEANNLVVRGVFDHYRQQPNGKNHFVFSAVEHPSLIKTAQAIAALGARVDFVPVNRQGVLDLQKLKSLVTSETALVSVMMANNETGTIFPIQQVVDIARSAGALVHTDIVQAYGKMPLNLSELKVDYATISAHKIRALKGCGALFVRKNSPLAAQMSGGGQERSRRGGTENILSIASFGEMAKQIPSRVEQMANVEGLRDYFETLVKKEISDVKVTSGESLRIPNTSSLVIDGVDGETLLMALDLKGYSVSTGAACSSGSPEPSPVLLAIGLSRQEAQNSLRVSLGEHHTQMDILNFIEVLKVVVERIRSLHQQYSEGEHHVEL